MAETREQKEREQQQKEQVQKDQQKDPKDQQAKGQEEFDKRKQETKKRVEQKSSELQKKLDELKKEAASDPAKMAEFDRTVIDLQTRVNDGPGVMAPGEGAPLVEDVSMKKERADKNITELQQNLSRMQQEAASDPAKMAEYERTLMDLEKRLNDGPRVIAPERRAPGSAEEIEINPSSPAGNRNP